jgi:stage V sporulation protein G
VEITEVRIKLMDDPHDRLQAFCSVTFDGCFVIRDLKIIQGSKGPFVAMPSRKLTDRCPKCHAKNHLRAMFCNQCGAKLDEERATKDTDGRAKLYADIAHPINSNCRELIQDRVLVEFESELIHSKEPGYLCTYDDYGEDKYATLKDPEEDAIVTAAYVRENGTQHRIEPASPNHPQAPHHAAPAPRYSQAASAGVKNVQRDQAESNDTFGAGL